MAKKIKFPLIVKDDFPARNMDELREHFDLEKVVGYFLDGKLLTWLEAHSYDKEIIELKKLNREDNQLHHQLIHILGIESHPLEMISFDVETVKERNSRLAELKQYTSDPTVLDKINQVAFNQEDLSDLLDEGIYEIYLCNNTFSIPLRIENKHYIGIGKAIVTIRSKERVDFSEKKIIFDNVQFDEVYTKVAHNTPERIYALGEEAENQGDYLDAFKYYTQLVEKNHADAIFKLGVFFDYGYGVQKDYSKAIEWYKKAANLGHVVAMNNIGAKFENGEGVDKDIEKAKEWYMRAADLGYAFSMKNLGSIYYFTENNYEKSYEWYKKAADQGNAYASYILGWQYEHGQGISADYEAARKYYSQGADGYANNDYTYDPTYRYAYVSLHRQNDINSTREWLERRYNTQEKKKAFLEYSIKNLRDTQIPRHWASIPSTDFFIWDKPKKQIEQTIQRNIRMSLQEYNRNVRQAVLRYGNEVGDIYNNYMMACIVAGNQNIGLIQKNEFVSSIKQQLNVLLNGFEVPDPSYDILGSIRLEEGYDSSGSELSRFLSAKVYKVENGGELNTIFRNLLESSSNDVIDSAHGYICSVISELADNLMNQTECI